MPGAATSKDSAAYGDYDAATAMGAWDIETLALSIVVN
jgi:hypothetical protein